jgi:three-Cys-motif partner protein
MTAPRLTLRGGSIPSGRWTPCPASRRWAGAFRDAHLGQPSGGRGGQRGRVIACLTPRYSAGVPDEKFVEARRQTSDKLEVMAGYWSTWAHIIANARNLPFCSRHLWMIDAFAGNGLHLSSTDPDGIVRGTAVQAALAAKTVQAGVPNVTVHVRAVEMRKGKAKELHTAVQPYVTDGVDVTVWQSDWVDQVPAILAEIARQDHPHAGAPIPGRGHQHRSLWLLDPYGPTQLDRRIIEALPYGSEVVINLDIAGLVREIGKADGGDLEAELRTEVLFGGHSWRGGSHATLDKRYAETFEHEFKHRHAYPLRQSGNQRRSLIHLTNSPRAVDVFAKAHERATSLNTLIARGRMSTQAKHSVAVELFNLFRGQTLTTREMRSVSDRFDLTQLRGICAAAEVGRYGKWHSKGGTMEWFAQRAPEPPPPTLGL